MRYMIEDRSTGTITIANDKWDASQIICNEFARMAEDHEDVKEALDRVAGSFQNFGQCPDESTQALLNISVTEM